MPASVASIDTLLRWSALPLTQPPLSALGDERYLLVDAAGTLPDDTQGEVLQLLRTLPCPSIAIGTDSPLARACDTQVATLADAAPLIATIEHSPLAATVLAQLLRLIEGLSLADALVAESLAYATLQSGAEFRRWLASGEREAPAVITEPDPAVLAHREDERLRLTLNRASNRNGMSVEMRDALCEALQLALSDDAIRDVQIDARGKCFSTGGDLSEFGSAPDSSTAHLVRSLALPGRLLARCAERVTVTVHGACIGSGAEFPAFAGTILARPGSWFQLPELKYGLIPGAGGCVSISRRVGRQRTAWLALSAAMLKTRTALSWGLVDRVLD